MRTTLAIICAAALFVILFPYSAPDFDKFLSSTVHTVSTIITVIIWCLLILGVFSAIRITKIIDLEDKFLRDLDIKLVKKLREMYAVSDSTVTINDISLLLPKRSNLIVDRLFEHILQEGKLRRIDSSLNTVSVYKTEYHTLYIPIQTYQRLALQLGILGTFIGLISAFQQLGLENSSVNDIGVGEWITPLQTALEYSFSTSIAGLHAAVSISIFSLSSNSGLNKLFAKLEETCDTFITVLTKCETSDDHLFEINQLTERVKQLSNSVEAQGQKITNQSTSVDTLLSGIKELSFDITDTIKQLKEAQIEFLEDIKNNYEYLSPESIAEAYKTSLMQSSEFLTVQFSDKISQVVDKFEEISAPMSAFSVTLSELEKKILEQDSKYSKELKNEFSKSLDKIQSHHKEFVRSVENIKSPKYIEQAFQAALNRVLANNTQVVQGLAENVDKILKKTTKKSKRTNRYSFGKQRETVQKLKDRIKKLFNAE